MTEKSKLDKLIHLQSKIDFKFYLKLKKTLRRYIKETGELALFIAETLFWLRKPPFRIRLILESIEFIGVQSLFIVCLSSLCIGLVFGLQTYFGFKIVGAQSLVGSTVAFGLAKEIAPVICALLVTGRAGAAIAAQLGTMRVTEQIDAMEVMAVNSKQYLVLPKMIGGTLAMPILSGIFLLIANIGAYIIVCSVLKVDSAVYLDKIAWYVDPWDIFQGLIKATAFGFIFTSVASFKGFNCGHGAEGVGLATTEAVVLSSVLILIFDFIITSFLPVNL